MAEFCVECWNKLNGTHDSKWRYVLSWERELCEGCGRYKHVILVERFGSRTQRLLAEAVENIRNRRGK